MTETQSGILLLIVMVVTTAITTGLVMWWVRMSVGDMVKAEMRKIEKKNGGTMRELEGTRRPSPKPPHRITKGVEEVLGPSMRFERELFNHDIPYGPIASASYDCGEDDEPVSDGTF